MFAQRSRYATNVPYILKVRRDRNGLISDVFVGYGGFNELRHHEWLTLEQLHRDHGDALTEFATDPSQYGTFVTSRVYVEKLYPGHKVYYLTTDYQNKKPCGNLGKIPDETSILEGILSFFGL